MDCISGYERGPIEKNKVARLLVSAMFGPALRGAKTKEKRKALQRNREGTIASSIAFPRGAYTKRGGSGNNADKGVDSSELYRRSSFGEPSKSLLAHGMANPVQLTEETSMEKCEAPRHPGTLLYRTPRRHESFRG
ncbi:PREDICTED: uncharacterized protein LOC108546839 [Eufriesea mexicana]|uniref:uncharacterized protein LOC108546839 n=1 Tax=Eufriesea mexicana TaxID=516756 RepID=UPI00083C7A5D|nr:PREDICTED: uncharacterized protein LOC108546839 [Eufriesea mexicana]